MAKLGEYWAIVELDTELFLGLPYRTRGGRGFTYVEPKDIGPPRLFINKRDAIVALGWWLKGPFEVRDWEEGSIEPVRDKPFRDPSNYEVVEVSIGYTESLRRHEVNSDELSRLKFPDTTGR